SRISRFSTSPTSRSSAFLTSTRRSSSARSAADAVSVLSIQINGQAVSLANLGAHDESYRGQNHHEQRDLVEHYCRGWKQMHCHHDSKIQYQQAGDDAPDALTQSNPDDWDET